MQAVGLGEFTAGTASTGAIDIYRRSDALGST